MKFCTSAAASVTVLSRWRNRPVPLCGLSLEQEMMPRPVLLKWLSFMERDIPGLLILISFASLRTNFAQIRTSCAVLIKFKFEFMCMSTKPIRSGFQTP
jgi:hypothetical protein